MLTRTSVAGALRCRGVCGSRTPALQPLSSLTVQQRFVEYWAIGVTGRTQPYAQGDMLPRVDNTKNPVSKATTAAASLTGNPNGIAYDASNIFSATGYSPVEKEHYHTLRGVSTHKMEPLPPHIGKDVAVVIQDMSEDGTLEEHWWGRILIDFPSMKTPCTAEFRQAWEAYYAAACAVAEDNAAVAALSKPFLETQMQQNHISYPMVWRIAERLCDTFDTAPNITPYERRGGRLAVEQVTKVMLDTIAAQPWAHEETTSPLHVDISNFRAWHEAGNW